MTVGYFSPLPPAPTGVADYAATLLEALRRYGRVEIEPKHCDVALYQLGNNHLHREIYARALAQPGVAVLHDAVLQHFFLGALTEQEYADEFVCNYGEWMRGLATDLWKQRARSGADSRYFEYPMLKRIATASRAIVVHNPAAASLVARHAPDAKIFEIPHLFVPPPLPAEIDTLRFRRELGLGPRTLLVGVFGHLRESKRLTVILRGMQRVWSSGADAKLLVAGAFASSDLERSLSESLTGPRILRIGYLSEPDFWRYAAATDICLNLRFPTAGETSGISIRMMGIGKTVVFTDGLEVSRFPTDACLRVNVGAAEEEMLADYVVWLASDCDAAVEIGRRASAHITSHHNVDRVAQLYWEILGGIKTMK